MKSPISDFFNAVSAPFSDPRISTAFIMSTILVGFGVYLHLHAEPDKSWVKSLSASLSNSTAMKPVGDFIGKNTDKFIGALIFLPVVFSAPPTIRFDSTTARTPSVFLLAALTTGYCVWMKEFHIYDYWIQAVGLLLFFHLKTNAHRFIILAVVALMWFISYETATAESAADASSASSPSSRVPPSTRTSK